MTLVSCASIKEKMPKIERKACEDTKKLCQIYFVKKNNFISFIMCCDKLIAFRKISIFNKLNINLIC